MKEQALHSRYNPLAEAERYLDSLTINSGVTFFILVEPGAGYLSAVLKKKYPQTKIIALHAEKTPEQSQDNKAHAAWSPEHKQDLRDFLEQEIPDIEAAAIKIIEWRPALSLYGSAYRFLLAESAAFIKQADASARTTNQFGKRWFKNFFRNLAFITKIIIPETAAFPILVAGAGPGLEDTIPLIHKERGSLIVAAVSSSVAALKEKNITPDIAVATDGGAWALLHLYECFRGTKSINLAVNLTAALPSQCENANTLVLCDGSLWQSLILKGMGIPFITLPQRGTVSASALDLAFALTTDNVFVTGVDLSHRGIRSHARPYSFDRLWYEKASRVNPYYSQIFARSSLIASGGSHSVYANWFKRQLEHYPDRLYSLGSNNEVFSSLKTARLEIPHSNTSKNKPAPKIRAFTPTGNPRESALTILTAALKNPEYGNRLCAELSTLLCSGASVSAAQLETEIKALVKEPFASKSKIRVVQ